MDQVVEANKVIGHTPGPWSAPRGGQFVFSADDRILAEVFPDAFNPEPLPRAANASLMASAPDLLAANHELLKLVRRAQERLCAYLIPDGSNDPDECMNELLEMFDGPEQRRIENAARAAIAKAEQH